MSQLPPALHPSSTLLMIVDMQERLLPVIHESSRCIKVVGKMIEVARLMDLPILVTEQYPAGLGGTCMELTGQLNGAQRFQKTQFSGCTPEVVNRLRSMDRRNVIVTGIEAHVCVQMTVLDLLRLGHTPFVIGRGISSRHASDRDFAIRLMRQAGAYVTSVESVGFELLGDSKSDNFKRMLDIIK